MVENTWLTRANITTLIVLASRMWDLVETRDRKWLDHRFMIVRRLNRRLIEGKVKITRWARHKYDLDDVQRAVDEIYHRLDAKLFDLELADRHAPPCAKSA